jgi:broad specificity phosphatase PhoE
MSVKLGIMKWPKQLTLIRHDESAYNALKKFKESSDLYKKFRKSYESDWRSEETKILAREVKEKLSLNFGDHNTPLAENSGGQAIKMAGELKNKIVIPDVIFVSPYQRTWETLKKMYEGWPELKKVRVYEEERIREQEHGLLIAFNDKRIMFSLFPEQRELFEKKGAYWYRFPQGENVPDVRERNRSWITTLVREFAGKQVLAVTHHLTILATRANLERLSAEEFLRLDEDEEPINAGVTIYEGQEEENRLLLTDYNLKLY